MNVENLWDKICNQLKSGKVELQTKTGKWFAASYTSDAIVIDRAIQHRPSSSIAMKRFISKEEFINAYPYYELWKEGINGIRKEATNVSQNTSYIFSLIDEYL